jgi:light-regulated signal transduction histidine kinase (bacteriophytochrome)
VGDEVGTSATALNECANEPISRPGSIQPHGVLLVVAADSGLVVGAAGRVGELLGAAKEVLSRPLEEIIGQSLESLTRASGFRPSQEPLFLGAFRLGPLIPALDILAHERDGSVLIELEPSLDHRPSAPRLLGRLRAAIADIKRAPTIEGACTTAARAVRDFTGHDRAMVYRFLEDHSGNVISESSNGALPSLHNHHFPEGDIPQQARELYARNLIRVIPDVHYVPAPLLTAGEGAELDMSDCALRSVSPVHLQYLRNMGVGSSMSTSVMGHGRLWGLIACHSISATLVPYEVREVCKQVAAALGQQIETLTARFDKEEGERLSTAREVLLANLAGSDAIEIELVKRIDDLLRLIPADGILLSCNGRVHRAGLTPDPEAAAELASWSRRKDASLPFATSSLSSVFEPASAYQAETSGALAASVTGEDPIDIVWLRREHREVVEWGGHPHKDLDRNPETGRLNPRASFSAWREIVKGRSAPWTSPEIDAAQRLRDGVERIKERQRFTALQASLIHMSRVNAMGAMASSIAHELNQPLTAAASYARSAAKLLRRGEAGEEIASIVDRAAEQSLRAGELIRKLRQLAAPVEAAVDSCSLAEIIEGACAIALIDAPRLGITVDIEFDRSLDVLADKIQAQQVLLNLIRNALEAMEDSEQRLLTVEARRDGAGQVKVTVRDTGSGVSDSVRDQLFDAFNSSKEGGLGIGLSICRTIIEGLGGKIWLEESGPTGTCFAFSLQESLPDERAPESADPA